MNDVASELAPINFGFMPVHKPEDLHENMRSSIARGLPFVAAASPAHEYELSIAGGGPSLAETKEFTGHIAAINGTLGYLLSRGVVPEMCGVCDPSPHMVDIVDADPRVTYFLASIVHPSVYDKLLKAGCRVVRWNSSSVPGGEAVLDEIEPHWHQIGGGSTMGLRWLVLGYTLGFRTFHLHGFDSSFRIDPERGRATHAYPDHQDAKEWIELDGYMTKPNFIGQVADFELWMNRMLQPDVDPVSIKVYGDGLLQAHWRAWKAQNPHAHEGGAKPVLVTDGFVVPFGDRTGMPAMLLEARYIHKFMAHIHKRGVCVQAGGNIGVYPAHLAQYFERVYTFEPDANNFACLVQNLGKNKVNIIAYQAALAGGDGSVSTEAHELHNCGAIRVVESGPVPRRAIDGLGLSACDLIWLDIEGYELNALKGAEKTIARYRPAVIIEENETSLLHGIPLGAARAWLQERGYKRKIKWGNDTMFLAEWQ